MEKKKKKKFLPRFILLNGKIAVVRAVTACEIYKSTKYYQDLWQVTKQALKENNQPFPENDKLKNALRLWK